MAQHDYNLSNATGANFRADLNDMAAAIATVNSGATEPAVKFPGMLWLDLSGGGDGVMRRRNQANSAWLNDIGIDSTARAQASAAQTTANAALPKTGGTMTGAIILPTGEPTNNQALSRAWADTLYQVKLPTASGGSLLVGTAGGWTVALPPGANTNILALSGGSPSWQATGTVAAPGVVVRTLPDGTIDSSFIPQVASGLKFCGTFKPAVNAEYPTTGGHGAGGAPAIGDFWVIDGLTTGGYTYLTGSLAGVTVYNGDSIAFNGTANWYKMGNTVNVTGYVKTDGSVAMAADFDMGAFTIKNVGGVIGRSGSQVPLTNFKIDATNIVISPQRTSGADLAAMQGGQLGTDLGRMQLYVGAGASNRAMLAITIFSDTANYAAGSYVIYNGQLYRAPAAVAAGTFVATQWVKVMDSSGGEFTGRVTVPDIVAGPTGSLGAKVYVGDDAALWDVNAPATLAVRGQSNNAQGAIQFGDGPVISRSTGTELNISGRLTLSPVGGENGELALLGTGTYSPSVLDSVGEITRIFGGAWAGFRFDRSTGDFSGINNLVVSQAIQLPVPAAAERSLQWLLTDRSLNMYCNDNTKGWGLYDTTSAKVRISSDVNSNFSIEGNAYAKTFNPTCDERIKHNIEPVTARNLSPGLYSFERDGTEGTTRGPIAQRVQTIAPEYVNEYDNGNEKLLSVDLMGLTYEMACNLADRVRALELAANTHPEDEPA